MKKILPVLALLCLASGASAEKPSSPENATTNTTESCSVDVEPRGTDGLKINAWSCYADLSTFWAVVESHIAQMQLSDIRRLRIEGGPLGKDHLAAMSFAWGKSCAKRDPEAFVRAYRSTKASEVLAPSLAASRLVPFSIDYFYPAKPSSKGTHIIRHPACRLGLLPPLIIYRQEHDN